MKKETRSKKRDMLKVAFFSLTLIATVFLFIPSAKAATSDVCDYEDKGKVLKFLFKKSTYCKLKMFVNPEISISETVTNIFFSSLIDVPLGVVLHTNADDIGLCGNAMIIEEAENAGIMSGGSLNLEVESGSSAEFLNEDEVKEIKERTENKDCSFNSAKVSGRTSGSFAGVAALAYNTAISEPPPVNLAYYAKHNLQKMPVVNNTAFAQTSIYDSFGLRLFMDIWEVSRNVAYAMLSIIMLVIGIMISTGRKINPQTVVTAQTALPKVVISLILITFSYPIGAIFASAALPLTFAMLKIFMGDFMDRVGAMFGGQKGQIVNFNPLISWGAILVGMLGSAGIGLVMVILMLIMTVVAVFVVGVKLLIINVKILLQIVVAPIQFAIAAVPGQEHIIKDWFKQMIAKVLAIPAMVLMLSLGWYVLLTPFLDIESLAMLTYSQFSTVTQFYNAFGWFGSLQPEGIGQVYANITTSFLMLALVAMMIMFMALKVDKKVEEFVLGNSGKGGKR